MVGAGCYGSSAFFSQQVVALIKSALALASLYQQSALGKLSVKEDENDADGLKAAVLAARKALKDSPLTHFSTFTPVSLMFVLNTLGGEDGEVWRRGVSMCVGCIVSASV